MAGLLDAYTMTGNKKSMGMVEAMADYFYKRITKVIREKGTEHWQRCLENEFGGMNDVGTHGQTMWAVAHKMLPACRLN